MNAQQKQFALIGGGAAVLIFFGPQLARWLSEKIGGAAAGIIVQTATGAVIGIGKAVGIPETDAALCQQYVDAGDFWQASFYCPAGTFLKASWGAIFDPRTGEQIGTTEPGATEIITIVPALPGTSAEGQISDWPAA